MKEFNLRTMLRVRLPIAKSPEYMSWLKARYPHMDLHHILGSNKTKLNDYLLCPIPHELHMKIENGVEVEGYSFEEQLMEAITWSHIYMGELETKLRKFRQ